MLDVVGEFWTEEIIRRICDWTIQNANEKRFAAESARRQNLSWLESDHLEKFVWVEKAKDEDENEEDGGSWEWAKPLTPAGSWLVIAVILWGGIV